MNRRNRTFRYSESERIEGIWRLVFARFDRPAYAGSGPATYVIAPLTIYADGVIDSYFSEMDLEGLLTAVGAGRISVQVPDGALMSEGELGRWEAREAEWFAISDEDLVQEVADEIERLNGRATSSDRCVAAVYQFAEDPSPANQQLLREAYLRVPRHNRLYVLGDMDVADRQLRTLITPVGEVLFGWDPEEFLPDAVPRWLRMRITWRRSSTCWGIGSDVSASLIRSSCLLRKA